MLKIHSVSAGSKILPSSCEKEYLCSGAGVWLSSACKSVTTLLRLFNTIYMKYYVYFESNFLGLGHGSFYSDSSNFHK